MGKDTSVRFDLIRLYRLCVRGDVSNNASAYLAIPLFYQWQDAAAAVAVWRAYIKVFLNSQLTEALKSIKSSPAARAFRVSRAHVSPPIHSP